MLPRPRLIEIVSLPLFLNNEDSGAKQLKKHFLKGTTRDAADLDIVPVYDQHDVSGYSRGPKMHLDVPPARLIMPSCPIYVIIFLRDDGYLARLLRLI